MKTTPCVLNFFPDAVLVTTIEPSKQKELTAARREAAQSEGKGGIRARLEGFAAIREYADSLGQMDQQQILEENTRSIPKKDVRRIGFTGAKERVSMDNQSGGTDDGKLTIRIPEGRLVFKHGVEDRKSEIKRYLKSWISGKHDTIR